MTTYIKHQPIQTGFSSDVRATSNIRASHDSPLQTMWNMILKRKIMLFSLVFLAILLPVLYLVIRYQPKIEAAWMDDTFAYRQTVAISNTSTAITNQYIKITLNTSALIAGGKMQADCDDIRVTNINGKTLTHFIDGNTTYACGTTTTSIFVLVDSIPTSGVTLLIYYGNSSAVNIEPRLGTQQYPAISCQNILQHRGDSNGNGLYYIAPSGNPTTTIQVYCDMTTSSGGWIKVYEGLCTSATSTSRTTGNVVEISSNYLAFNQMRIAAKNWNYSDIKTTTETALMKLTFSGYYQWLHSQPDTPNPDIQFYSAVDGIQDVKFTSLATMMHGYGNSWRRILPHFYTQPHDSYMYLGSLASAGINRLEWGYGDYNSHMNDTSPTESGLGLTPRSFQEIYVWIRENTITLINDQTAGTPTNEEKSQGPVAYWKFDEGNGTTANNSFGNTAWAGTVTGPTWQTEDQCISGKCLYQDGLSNKYTVISSDITSGWAANNDFTVNLWFNCKGEGFSAPPYSYLAGLFIHGNSADSGTGGFYLRQSSISCANMIFQVSATTVSHSIVPNLTSGANKWAMITAEKEGDTLKLYENGILVGSQTFAGANWNVNVNQQTLIGSVHGRSVKGLIDDVKVYPYARTAAQIKADYVSKGTGAIKGTSVQMGTNVKNSDAFSNGLVGYWKMDEATSPAVDSSGNGNTGTWANSPAATSGVFGNGIDIPGVGGSGVGPVVNVADSDSIDVGYTNSMTTAFWIKNDTGVCAAIIKKTSMWEIYRCTSSLVVRFNGASPTDYSSPTALTNGQWYHVVVTRNYQTGKTILYLNGQQDSTWTFSLSAPTTTNGLGIGAYNGGNWAIDGKLDEVRLYNRELSPKEVRDLYNWAPGPVIYYNFDEGTGTTNVYDKSGNNNTGTMNGTMTASDWVPGKYGSALDFDGSDDYVVPPGQSFMGNATSEFTVSGWINPRATAGTIFHNYYPTSGWSTGLVGFSSGKLSYIVYNLGVVSETGSTPLNTWTYVSLTRDAAGNNKLYKNGVLVASNTGAYAASGGANEIGIGRYRADCCQFDSPGWYNGLIDDFKLYNYARSSKQIVEDMNAGHPAGGSPVASQQNYFRFDEGYGNTANDSGYGNNNGTLNSGASWSNNCRLNKCIYMNKTNSDVDVSGVNLDTTQNWTISTWVNVPSVGGNNGAIFALDGNHTWYFNSNQTILNTYWGGSIYTVPISNNTWFHAVLTRDGNTFKTYIDGVLKGTGATSATSAVSTMFIGSQTGSDYYMQGYLDEFKIYKSTLSEDEIKLDYNQGSALVLGAKIEDTNDNPASYWKFDEGQGTTAADSGTNGITATVAGSNWTTAKINTGMNIGTSINLGDQNVLEGQTGVTIEAWVYPTVLAGTDRQFFDKGSWTNADMAYRLMYQTDWGSGPGYPNGYWRFHIKKGGGDNSCYADGPNAASAPRENQWHHIAGVYDGSFVRIYDNGVQIGSAACTGTVNTNTYNAFIGSSWPGKIDEFKFYNYGRSSTQVAADAATNALNPSLPGAPIAEWKLDENTGANAYDTSGNGNTGTIANATWTTGKVGAALSFNGSTSKLSKTTFGFNSNNYTLEAWIKPASTQATYAMLFDYEHCTINNWGVQQNNTTTNQFYTFFRGTDAVWHDIGAGVQFTADQWQHITVVKDGTYLKMYRNGLLGANVDTSYSAVQYDTSKTINVGNGCSDTRPFNGAMDHIKIYNYARTPAQIAYDYNRGGPVGYWRMDECQGATAYDSSGNGNNGTITIGGTGTQTAVGTCTTAGTAWGNGVNGKYSNSLNFDGSDDYIEINPESTDLNLSQQGSISAWVKLASVPTAGNLFTIISEGGISGIYGPFHEIYNTSGTPKLCLWQDGTINQWTCGTSDFSSLTNQWIFTTSVWDGSTTKIYINGQLENTQNRSGDTGNGTKWGIGRNPYNDSRYFNGQIDDAKVFNYALTAEQVKNLYNAGAGVQFAPITGSP